MAHLGSMTTDKRLAFDKYVTQNKRLNEIEFEIEKNQTAILFERKGTILSPKEELKAGMKIRIIDPNLFIQNNQKYAQVQYKTIKGVIFINKIRKPTGGNGTQYEDEVVDAINEYIKKAGGVINIKLKGDNIIYKDIRYAVKVDTPLKNRGGVKGDPKADIILCSDIKNPLVSTSIYISHKKKGGPEAFQQYGGLNKRNNYSMKKFTEYLTEAAGKNLHMEHLEDMVFNEGVKGTRDAINTLRNVRDMLAGHSKSRVNITTKWDGAPAIFAGVDPEDDKFFVAKKGIFNKNPQTFKSIEDINNGGLAGELKDKFHTRFQ
jgi:hypothetical protein